MQVFLLVTYTARTHLRKGKNLVYLLSNFLPPFYLYYYLNQKIDIIEKNSVLSNVVKSIKILDNMSINLYGSNNKFN